MPKNIPPDKARQGKLGLPVLLVLIAGLALAIAVWGGLEFYGEAIDQQSTEEPGAATPPSTEEPGAPSPN